MKLSQYKWAMFFVLAALGIGSLIFLYSGNQHPVAKSTPEILHSNFDVETQAMIASGKRVVFLVPFSHWDTDWHQNFDSYSQLADQNILKAIQLAKQYPRFRYTLEQVLFVQHFWDTHPDERADLIDLVRKRQITFAWAGITQPDTSLVAPSIQVHNLQLGQAWISQTFGPEYVPHTAWQSDAFGNSAAFPTFLSQFKDSLSLHWTSSGPLRPRLPGLPTIATRILLDQSFRASGHCRACVGLLWQLSYCLG